MEIINIYKQIDTNLITIKISPKYDSETVHTILLEDNLNNRNLMKQFKEIKNGDYYMNKLHKEYKDIDMTPRAPGTGMTIGKA